MTRVTAAVLCNSRGEYLLARRPEGKNCAGLWEFPGGKIEPGETPEACLARECREELGIGVRVGPLLAQVTHAYPALTVQVSFYDTQLVHGVPAAREHNALRWVLPCALTAAALCPADRAALGDILCAKRAGEASNHDDL